MIYLENPPDPAAPVAINPPDPVRDPNVHATVLLSQRVGAEPPEPDRITIWNMDRVVIEDRDGNQLSCTPAPR